MNRYVVDERNGCIAIRDTHNENYDPNSGLHQDMPDVVKFEMGTEIKFERFHTWDLDPSILNKFYSECDKMNKK
jgi:hypothetical protein